MKIRTQRIVPPFATALTGIAVLTALSLSGCASTPRNAVLESARATVDQTAADPIVVARAPLELKSAQDTIARADQILSKDDDKDEVTHLAYLATRRAGIASELARARNADEQLKQVQAEADRVRLASRTQEANAANAQANAANAQANVAKAQASAAQTEAALAQGRVRQLESEISDIEGQQTERGLIVTLGDVLFAFGKSDLNPAAAPRLDKLAGFLKQFPNRTLTVEGYTDAIGSDGANIELSQRRADAVKLALIQRGVEPGRINARGYGKSFPVADNRSEDGRQLNRRVEVVISDERGTVKPRA